MAGPGLGRILAGIDALLFDLDGVVTDTAAVHVRAWKALFDRFLTARAAAGGEPFRPFEQDDYLRYVDGRRRYDGVASFLASRRIALPWGDPGDGPDEPTVCGLGNRKDAQFRRALDEEGVTVFADAVALLDAAAAAGVRLAVVSASENADAVLGRAGLLERFGVRVTGREAAAWGLVGKPAPDTFLKAAELLGTPPSRAAVLEDATAGIQAARAGGFTLVVGVDRGGAAASLSAAGAHVVVSDLGALLAPA